MKIEKTPEFGAKGSFTRYVTPLEGEGALICYEALRGKRGEGV